MQNVGLFNLKLDCEYYKKKILKNEPKIIKKYPPTGYDGEKNDGDTGLGYDCLTSRFYHFNVLEWWGMGRLKREIKKCYNLYTISDEKCLFVQCWANVMRKGQQIKPHSHRSYSDVLKYSAVSGNLFISSDELTQTYYEGTPIENKVGRMVLFPSNVIHWTSEYSGSSERISIAFDIRTHRDWKEDVFDGAKKHWVQI